MKKKGRHPDRKLTPVGIKAIKKAGRYADGNGLYLMVDPSGARRWVLRTLVHGKRRDIGLGGLSLVSLADAREEAAALRKVARKGGDPLADRRLAKAASKTFADLARDVHKEQTAGSTNAKHAAQWLSTMEDHAFPRLGDKPIGAITSSDIRDALLEIWHSKPVTAQRLRQRIGVVFDVARSKGMRSGVNPVDDAVVGLPKQAKRDAHHEAMPYGDIPEFLRRLRQCNASEPIRLAFEFLILTAGRSGEVLEARPDEFDIDRGMVWSLPPARMKARRAHRVPLAPRCVEIVERARKLCGDGEYIFPGKMKDRPLAGMSLLRTLDRLGVNASVHGFRSSFRMWAAEKTTHPRELAEMALAHTIPDRTEAAYQRSDLFEKRRLMMEQWAQFCTGASRGTVVQIATARAQA